MSNQSRRKFLQSTALISAALPLAGIGNEVAARPHANSEGLGAAGDKPALYYIIIKGTVISINAGHFSREVNIGEGIRTTHLRIGEKELLAGTANDFRLSFHAASPNGKPAGLILTKDQQVVWADAENATAKEQPVQWSALATVGGANIGSYFKLARKNVSWPQKGVTRLQLSWRGIGNNALKDVAIDLWYEIYDGYPAIRKWMQVTNNSAQWLKIDQLVIDDIALDTAFTTPTPLTPEDRGAESCIISFSNSDLSTGIIAASEIPSAIRQIKKNGAMGYADDYFEWVLGPSEHFTSEPVFQFAFYGNNIQTISGISTPLDRAVETPFKDFLRHAVGLQGSSAVPAPIWCSYSNFLVSLSDTNMRQQADIAARIGFTTFQLDEGWAATPSPGGSEPGPTFPDFESTCEYIRSKGMQLGLWISCFRTMDAKDLAAMPDARALPLHTNTKRGYGMSFSSTWRDYFANDLIYMRDKYGMLYVKMDLTNISKGDIADTHESRTKKESLLRGLRGLLQVNKKVGELAPDVWTQVTHEIYWKTPGPPADIAVLKHACAFHTTPNTYKGAGTASKPFSKDWTFDPVKMRAALIDSCLESRQRFFNHRGLPLYGVEFYAAHAVNIKGSLSTSVQDRQVCSWLMGAPTVFAGDLSSLTEENILHYSKRFNLLKRLQQQYDIYKHFQYSGVPVPTDTDWHWWGKINEKGYGVAIVIRGSGGKDTRAINIPWVTAGKKYTVTALLSGKTIGRYTGAQLQQGIVKLALPALGQEILELSPAS